MLVYTFSMPQMPQMPQMETLISTQYRLSNCPPPPCIVAVYIDRSTP